MKKIIYSLTVLCLTFSVLSCTKENAESKFKRILMFNEEKYEYNSNGKISEYIGNDYTETYTYSGNTITKIFDSHSGLTPYTCVYKLNPSGYVSTSTTNYEDPRYPLSTSSYEYDSSGHLIKWTTSWGTSSMYTTYEYINGNLITEKDFNIKDMQSIEAGSARYEYYLDKENTLSNEYFGKGFLGKSSKNLLKKITGSNGDTVTYTYEYDKDNFVRNMTEAPSFGNTYSYPLVWDWI